MDYRGKVITAPFILIRDRIVTNVKLRIDTNGRITEIGEIVPTDDVVVLKNQILLPGFVNAHSHAFHRFLRGRSEIGTPGADTFWKWRDNMYKLVEDADFEKIKMYCKTTFEEMLMTGITTVGEFHYVHHGKGRFDLDEAVIDAANEAGIRLVLIETLYCRSGFAAADVLPEQKRFQSNVQEFLSHLEALERRVKDDGNVTIAVAAHSLRAVDRSSLQKLWNMTHQKRMAFHIHLEEQPKEIDDCLEVEGSQPSQFLRANIPINERLTAIHCTYTMRTELDEFAKAGVNVCVCPTTEGFLGDGIPELNAVDRLCLGTDCNNRLCFLEEMRWLAYCQNMKNNKRNIAALNAEKLLKISTENGAKSLGIDSQVGRFEVGAYFDFVGFDLESPRLSHVATEGLLDAIVFGCGNTEIVSVGVAGQTRYSK